MKLNVQTATAADGAVVISQGEQGTGAFTHRYSGPLHSLRWALFLEGRLSRQGEPLAASLETRLGSLALNPAAGGKASALLVLNQCDQPGPDNPQRPPFNQVVRLNPDQLFSAPLLVDNLRFDRASSAQGPWQLDLLYDCYLVDQHRPSQPQFRIRTHLRANGEGRVQELTCRFNNGCFSSSEPSLKLELPHAVDLLRSKAGMAVHGIAQAEPTHPPKPLAAARPIEPLTPSVVPEALPDLEDASITADTPPARLLITGNGASDASPASAFGVLPDALPEGGSNTVTALPEAPQSEDALCLAEACVDAVHDAVAAMEQVPEAPCDDSRWETSAPVSSLLPVVKPCNSSGRAQARRENRGDSRCRRSAVLRVYNSPLPVRQARLGGQRPSALR